MRLLVACHNYLAVVDTETDHVHRFGADLTGSPEAYYGISQDDDGWILVALKGGRIIRFSKQLAHSGMIIRVPVPIPPPACGVHQILFFDGKLYVPVTPIDQLRIYEGNRQIVSLPINVHGGDRHHLNSINVIDGDLVVVANNNKDRISQLYTVRQPQYVPSWRGGKEVHNVWPKDGAIHVLSSQDNAILRFGPDGTPTVARWLDHGSWARGLAACERRTFVGLSPGAGRSYRSDPVPGFVLVFDETWNALKRIGLPAAGQVHEIRLLDDPDAGHANKIMEGIG